MSISVVDVPGYGAVDTASVGAVAALCQKMANRLGRSFYVVHSAARVGHYAWLEARDNKLEALAVLRPKK